MKYTACLLSALLLLGCSQHKSNSKQARDILDAKADSMTVIHWQSAANRRDIYLDIANQIKAGELTKVNEVQEYSKSKFIKAGEKYTEDVNALRKERLHDADDELPKDAEKVFRQMAKEYNEVIPKQYRK